MNTKFLEQFYENVILPQYAQVFFGKITWFDHGSIGPDAFAHYFKSTDAEQYVLVFEDFPGSTAFDDGLSHEIISTNDEKVIRFGGDPPFKYVENITGYFTLYKEKD